MIRVVQARQIRCAVVAGRREIVWWCARKSNAMAMRAEAVEAARRVNGKTEKCACECARLSGHGVA